MHNDLLELPQRIIAFARIGLRPSPADIEAAIRSIDQAQASLRGSGHSAIVLHPARAALVSLRWGHLPHREACVAAVSALGSLMAVGESLEDA